MFISVRNKGETCWPPAQCAQGGVRRDQGRDMALLLMLWLKLLSHVGSPPLPGKCDRDRAGTWLHTAHYTKEEQHWILGKKSRRL